MLVSVYIHASMHFQNANTQRPIGVHVMTTDILSTLEGYLALGSPAKSVPAVPSGHA